MPLEDISTTEEQRFDVLEQRLSDKLDGIAMTRQVSSSSKGRVTQMIEVNESSAILYMIQERIRSFEMRFKKKSGFLLRLICAAVFAFYCVASEIYIQKLPALEVLFVAFLIAFLFNYYLIRDGQVLPYIEHENDNFKAKIAGSAGFCSIILFVYSFQHCEVTTALFCTALSWVIFALATGNINRRQVLLGILMTLLAGAVLQPNFSPEITENEVSEAVEEQSESTHLQGVVASLVAGLLFGYMNVCIRQLKNQNFITITHIFSYICAPFIPVFFPLQKLVSPTLLQWSFMIGLGLAFVFMLQVYIRSVQLENASKTLLVIPQFSAFLMIFSIIFGVSIFGEPSIFKTVCSLAILALSYQFSVEIGREFNKDKAVLPETKKTNDIPLQTFAKQDNLSLSQKLLDSQNS